jgi:hypothetical protein
MRKDKSDDCTKFVPRPHVMRRERVAPLVLLIIDAINDFDFAEGARYSPKRFPWRPMSVNSKRAPAAPAFPPST